MKYRCMLCGRSNFDSKQPHRCVGGFRKRGIKWEPIKQNTMEQKETGQSLSFGQQLVGLTFNPSGDAKVQRAKELCAELADLLKDDYMSKESSTMHTRLFDHTVGEILNAQMNVVKVLTLKY
jgi:hypothetical protein